jgi:hypothetical protein
MVVIYRDILTPFSEDFKASEIIIRIAILLITAIIFAAFLYFVWGGYILHV